MIFGSDDMCQARNATLVELKELGYPQRLPGYEYPQMLDACMVSVIKKLRQNGSETIGCCCGHGRYPMTVVYRARNGNAIEYYTSTILPRKHKFYKLDDEGFYYIPEVSPRKVKPGADHLFLDVKQFDKALNEEEIKELYDEGGK